MLHELGREQSAGWSDRPAAADPRGPADPDHGPAANPESDRAAIVNLASLMRHATAYIAVMSQELEEWAKAEAIALDERDEALRKCDEENGEMRRQLPGYEVGR